MLTEIDRFQDQTQRLITNLGAIEQMMTTIDNDITNIEGRIDTEIAARQRAAKTLTEKQILETQKVYHKNNPLNTELYTNTIL